jgi:hypothetical protein
MKIVFQVFLKKATATPRVFAFAHSGRKQAIRYAGGH